MATQNEDNPLDTVIDDVTNLKKLTAFIRAKFSHKGFRRYGENLSWMFFAKIITMVISIVATAYIARHLGPKNYGELSYAISFVGIVSFFANLGIDQILCRDIIAHPEKRNEYLGSALVLKITASVLSFFTCVMLALALSMRDVSLYLIFIISLSPFAASFGLLSNEFQADAKSKYPSIFSILVVFILNILKLLVIYYDKGVIFLAAIVLLEPILYSIMYMILRTRVYGSLLNLRFNKLIAVTMLKSGYPLIFASVFFMIYARIDQVMIKHMINAEAVGLYDAAVRLSEISYFIPNIIMAGIFPAIINAKKISSALYHKRIKHLILLLIFISSLLALITTVFSKYIILVVYGATFIEAVPILTIYVWSNVGAALILLTQQILVSENLTKNVTLTLFFGMLFNVILNILLIPKYGMSGAAFASLISYFIPFISMLFISNTRIFLLKILRS